jgi:hypothetical protein
VVATHEGEAGVRRAQREEDELPDPLGLHGGADLPGRGGEGVALVLGLHRRWPPVGCSVRNWDARGGIGGRRSAARKRRWASGVYVGAGTGWFRNGSLCMDGGDGFCEFRYVGPDHRNSSGLLLRVVFCPKMHVQMEQQHDIFFRMQTIGLIVCSD